MFAQFHTEKVNYKISTRNLRQTGEKEETIKMMDYETFKEVAREQLLNYMPSGFEGCTAEIRPVLKVNQKLDALELFAPMKESRQRTNVKPRIYLNYMYQD